MKTTTTIQLPEKLLLSVTFCIFFLFRANAQVSVTASAGTAGPTPYTSLGGAFTAINAGTHQGNITVSITGNSTEAASAVLNATGSGAASYTAVVIQPSGGAGRTISGNIGGALIDLNGASNVSINGLNTGGNSLTVENTSTGNTATSTIRFINDASNNKISNCNILGASTGTSLATVLFSGGTLTGNDNNRINTCMIGASGANFAVNAIYSAGTTGAENSNDSVTNCAISDYYSATLATTGVSLASNSTGWVIMGNKLFQSAVRNYTTANTHKGISILTGSGHQVTGNTIGYAAAASTGVYTMTSTVATIFIAIDLTVGTTPSTSVQGNAISAISLTSSSGTSTAAGVLCGIRTSGGNVDIGTVSGNTIGASTGTASLVLSTTTATGTIVGINVASAGNTEIRNNTFGAFQSIGNPSTLASGVLGITVSVVPAVLNIVNNTIGNATADNMVAGILGTTTGATLAGGVSMPVSPTAGCIVNIKQNTVQNISGFGSGTGNTRGIAVTTLTVLGSFAIDSNIINNMKSNSSLAGGSSALASCVGITLASGLNSFIRNNTITNIMGLNTGTTHTVVTGIIHGQADGTTISRNTIYDITNAATGTTATAPGVASGLFIRSGTNNLNVNNNFISLGSGQTTNTAFIGINYQNGSTPNPNLNAYNNTIAISGTVTTGAQPSFCILRGDLSSTTARTGPVSIINNILTNDRTGGTGKHFAIANNFGATLSATGWGANASNTNVLNANAATIGYWGADQTFAGWKTTTSCDANSFSGIAVTYVNPANNLHLSMGVTATYLESNGQTLAEITSDFDGNVRPGPAGSVNGGAVLTDIGADEFDGVPLDARPPVVTYTNLTNTSNLSNRTLTGFANVFDVGVATAAGVKPRFYYKKASNANAFAGNTSGDNGWKYVEATNSTSPFSFVVDYSLLTGGSANIGDTLQYFVVAQDLVPFVTANPSAGFVGTSVSSITTAPTSPNAYIITDLPLSGSYNVGSGQTFTTLTQAAGNLNLRGVSAPVTFVLTDVLYNTGTGETFPVTISAISGSSAVNTVTIRPNTSVSARIEGTNANAIIDLNGATNVIIDGRPGGTGGFVLGTNLIVVNTNTSGPAVRFINEASSNKILYTDLRSNNTVATGTAGAGVVNFGTTTGANGNDNNIIRWCDIHEETGGNPRICISSIGSATTVNTNNDNNIVDSCNIYNFFNAGAASAGVYVGANNGSWNISANHVYQTTPLTYTTGATHRAFWITPNTASLTSASGFVISNNTIGGSSSNGSGVYAMGGTVANVFNGMDISVGVGAATSIQNNTITNITLTGSSTASNAWVGINVANGNVDIGTVMGNTIGSPSVNGAITYTTTGSGGGLIGIRSGAGGVINIKRNTICGIDIVSNATTAYGEFFGINLVGGTTIVVDSNTVGSTGLPNSINCVSTSATATGVSRMSGIIVNPSGTGLNYTIRYNTIANINSNYSATGTQATGVKGIHIVPTGATSSFTIQNNLVYNLSTATQTTGSGIGSALVGIAVNATVSRFNVSQNTVHSLTLTGASTTAAVQNTGIFYSTPAADTNIVSRNYIHGLSLTAVNPAAFITGIDVAAGNGIIANNMIRLGIDSTGSSITTACTMRGITKNSGSNGIYFNTVLVAGTGVGSDLKNSFAFQRTGAGTDDVRNNVFTNTRTNAGAGAGHFAVALNNNTTYTGNYNLLSADSIGQYNGVGVLTLPTWKSTSGVDANSISSPIAYINATGDKNALNLHINAASPTPIEAYGTPVLALAVDVDFDGQARSAFTPIDLGADAGNFTPLDIAPPAINYMPLANTPSTGSRILTATITDASGIYFAGTLQPRIYYKKNAAGTYVSTQGVRVSGIKTNSTWDFTINAVSLGGLVGDDSIYYYVVAQDSTGGTDNLGSSPGGVQGTNVNTISVVPNPNSYKITPTIGPITYQVGTGQAFTTLTGNNGMFSYINTAAINGNIIIEITSDIEEPGLFELKETMELGAGGYSISIVPSAAVVRNITGAVAAAGSGLIRLSGADRVTINGNFAGSGQYLRFMNRPQAGVTILLNNDADRDTIKNCIVEGVNNTTGTILIGTTNKPGGTGNDSNAIINCMIRDTLGTLAANNIPNTGISSSGTATAGMENSNNAIIGNEIYNFGFNAINLNAAGMGDGWVISNNKIYQVIVKNNEFRIIRIEGGANHLISNNSIGGSNISRGGTAFTTSGLYTGIYIFSGANNTVLKGNEISNMYSSSTGVLSSAIEIAAGNHVIGGPGVADRNTIGTLTDSIAAANSICGIILSSTGTVKVENNLIQGIVYMDADFERAVGIYMTAGANDSLLNNEIRNIRHYSNSASGTLASAFAPAGIFVNGGTNHYVKGNLIHDLGTNPTTNPYPICGIKYATATGSVVTGNRIYNLKNTGAGTGTNGAIIVGILGLSGNGLFTNNQITVGNSGGDGGDAQVFGIRDEGAGNTTDYRFNSIYVTGAGNGANPSFGMYRNSTSVFSAVNNIVLNDRTNLSTGIAFAVGSTNAVTSANFNNNLLICPDTAALARIGGGTFGWNALGSLYTAGPNTNWTERTTVVSSGSLFTNSGVADLNIITTNPQSWYANGKGIPNAGVSGDYGTASGVRSTSIATGSVDIGSDEFTPTVLPPAAVAVRTPASLDSTLFYVAGRMVAKVKWGGAGSVPSGVDLRYYSGVNAPSTPGGKTMTNTYWDFAPTGGSGYDYDLTLMADTAVLGTVANMANLDIARYAGGTAWYDLTNTTVNSIVGNMTSVGLTTGLGIYTGTDGNNNPLPVRLNTFNAVAKAADVLVNWTTTSEQNNRGFEVERSVDGRSFESVGFVKGAGSSNRTLGYALTDANAFEKAQNNILYYRLKQLDFNGAFVYSKTVRVENTSGRKTIVVVSPNPFSIDYSITINMMAEGIAEMEMTDIQGRVVAKQTQTLNVGINTISMDDAAALQAGVYFVKVKANNETQVIKLVKE